MRRSLLAVGLMGLLGVAGLVAQGAAGEAAGRGGHTIQVHPGQLHSALLRATHGDTLVIHHGRYRGSFTIKDGLRLVGAPGESFPVIDGSCRTRVTIEVEASDVVLGRLKVVGATEGLGPVPAEVEVTDVQRGTFSNLLLRDTCDAEYGINVFATGPVTVADNRARGFSDAGIYVGGITKTGSGAVRAVRNDSRHSNRGIVVEDSSGGRVVISANRFDANTALGEGDPAGVSLQNSDGVLLKDNHATGNGVFGIRLDSHSDRNRLFGNVARHNPGGNFHDEGIGNCGSANHPNPFPSC